MVLIQPECFRCWYQIFMFKSIKILALNVCLSAQKPALKVIVSTRDFSGDIKPTLYLSNPPQKMSNGGQCFFLRRTWNMHFFSRFLHRGLVLAELLKNRATWGTLIALNEERIFQWHGSQIWPVLQTRNLQRWLNCLPPSLQLSAKDITPWEPLPWGSAGAAGSTQTQL